MTQNKVYLVAPAALERYERKLVLRAIGGWTKTHKYAPRVFDVQRRGRFAPGPLALMVADLIKDGYIERVGIGVKLTDLGWAYLNQEPVQPKYPTRLKDRRELRRAQEALAVFERYGVTPDLATPIPED